MGALSIAAALWRWRFPILLLAAIAGAAAAKLYIDKLRAERAVDQAALIAAAQANKETVEALGALKAEKAAAEKLLADRLARKTADARRLNDLIDTIQAQEATNACAASPGIRAVLDRLRDGKPAAAPVGQP